MPRAGSYTSDRNQNSYDLLSLPICQPTFIPQDLAISVYFEVNSLSICRRSMYFRSHLLLLPQNYSNHVYWSFAAGKIT